MRNAMFEKIREYIDVYRNNIMLKNELNKEKIATQAILMYYSDQYVELKRIISEYETLKVALAISNEGTFELDKTFVDTATKDVELIPQVVLESDKYVFTVEKVKND